MLRLLSTTADAFSITFCTCDVKRKTGGELVTLANMCNPAVRVALEKAERKAPAAASKSSAKHSDNATRNLLNLDSNRVVKVHIDLITHINGRTVVR